MTLIIDTFSGCDWMQDKEDIFSCCSIDKPCGIYEGDCDDNDECLGTLKCGEDNCLDVGLPIGNLPDCCYDPLQ